ncbi:MAG: hypothetical protein ACYC6Y_29260 [Thermoguttaceae bacterium]
MTAKYLLPCSCGEKIPVETTQAGENLLCSCGRTLTVPSMQGIRRLEPLPEPSKERKPGPTYGGLALAIALVGLLILAVGGAMMYRTHLQQPDFISMDYVSPWQSWLMWEQDLRHGVQLPEYFESPYLQARQVYWRYMIVGAVIAGVGVVLIASAALMTMAARSRRRRQP